MYLQHNLGLADNGDYRRSMELITSGPIGFTEVWPQPGSLEWENRFFNNWIPFWKMDWTLSRPTTTAVLIWIPGAEINYLFYSKSLLYLPNISIFPKFLLLGIVLLILKWVDRQPNFNTLLLFSLVMPFLLMITTTDYTAYLNSFYQDSSSFVYLLLLLAFIVILKNKTTLSNLIWCTLIILLLSASKPSNLYWPALAMPFVLFIWYSGKSVRLRRKLVIYPLTIIVLTFASALITKAGSIKANPFNSLFYGALAFSDHPSSHLRRLGMEDAIECLDNPAFTPVGMEYYNKYYERLSFSNTVSVILNEPSVAFKMLNHALNNMNDISLDYLSKYAIDDPRGKPLPPITLKTGEVKYRTTTDHSDWLNFWAILKYKYFPTGIGLGLFLIFLAGWFTYLLKRKLGDEDLSQLGIIVAIACIIDLTIAIFGDGKSELIKHLLLTNILFDISIILFLNSLILFSMRSLKMKGILSD